MDDATVPGLTTALRARGYRVRGPAGIGAGGAAWAADTADGARAVVSVLDLGLTLAERRAALARIESLREVRHPHLVSLLDVLPLDERRTALVTAAVEGPTVGAVSEVRTGWSAGEVVTLLVPLAQALETLHRAGLVHGDVAPENVVLAPGGRPVLIDLGAVVRRGPGTPGFATSRQRGDAAGDVFALARLGLAVLGDDGSGHEGLRRVLEGACARDAAERPSAIELATACFEVADPQPVEVPEAAVLTRLALTRLAAGGPAVRTLQDPRVAGRRRIVSAVGAVALAAAVTVGALVLVGGGPNPGGPHPVAANADEGTVTDVPAATGTVEESGTAGSESDVTRSPGAGSPSGNGTDAPQDPPQDEGASQAVAEPEAVHPGAEEDATAQEDDVVVAAAVALTERRADVLAARDADRLAEVTLLGSAAFLADLALLDQLAERGTVPQVRADVVEARRLEPRGDQELVLVRTRHLVAGEPQSAGPRSVVLVLARTPAGWRVAEVLDPAAAASSAGPVSASPGPFAG